MNYFKSIMLTAFALFALAACDTDDLRDDVDNLKDRVASLEAQVSLLNDNMTAIKRLLEGGQTITKVTNTDGTYKLKLSNGETISLTQGSKGEVAYPEITVNDEGQWVVNGEVLMQNGTPVQAVGTPGKDGIAPKFRITDEGSFWQVSYDNGANWEDVLDTDGQKVSAVSDGSGGSSADSFFEEVYVDSTGEFFVIKLKGQTEAISIPIVKDLLCEITEPETGMKNGYWEIGYGKTATTTVKVKGENVIVTAPAGWVATVSEADESTNVATLSITAPASAVANTRATADNGADVTVQVNKGASWAVAKIQVKAVEVVDSYYAVYNAGGNITINGIEVNQTKFPDATYIESNQAVTKEGIYFIKEGVTINYTGTGSVQNLIFIGDNSQKSSTVNVDVQIKLVQTSGEGHFLCKNIALVGTSTLNNQIFTYNTDSNPFKYVAFDQCQITPSAGKHILYLSSNTRSIENFSMENSTFKSESANQKYIISLGASTSQDYKNIVFKNNVFYCPEGKVNQFGLFVGSKAGIANCVLENNTFVNLETATTGMVYVDKLADISVKNNIFWTNTAGANACIIFRPVTTSPSGTTCVNNIVYKTMTFNWQMFYGGKAPFESMEQLNILEANPFDGGTFDLANGIFVPNAEYAEYGATN